MRMVKMAELKFQAPLASFETEEWNDFNDFQIAMNAGTVKKDDGQKDSNEKQDSENFSETISGSLQDLVKSLDEKITKCFCNYDEKVEKFAPVQIRSPEEIMSECQMWWTLTGNYGNILPIDWSKSYARKLQTKALHLGEKKEVEPQDLDVSDDEELAQAMDFHSMIINHHHHDSDHIFTADEVISEIENMMEDSSTDPSTPTEVEQPELPLSPYSRVRESLSHLPTYTESVLHEIARLSCPTVTSLQRERVLKILSYKPGPNVKNIDPDLPSHNAPADQELKGLSNTALNELLNEYELTIKELSEILVQELALRDELEYDKELKNQFISVLLTIQKRRRESQVDKKKRKNKTTSNNNSNSNSSNNNNNNNSPSSENGINTYLTTVIPYHSNQGPPTSEQLQIYIKRGFANTVHVPFSYDETSDQVEKLNNDM